ncbi:hypothetical protein DNTS_025203 [Danionella cerebrum]|uniref:Uncharacterized protein n=1 Tax=Danionella cerebrum TaxID=2873325 RepID=A0A553QI06_9TELE|nr:hypothetical protein DNTS_025203 [Danionella translucida]
METAVRHDRRSRHVPPPVEQNQVVTAVEQIQMPMGKKMQRSSDPVMEPALLLIGESEKLLIPELVMLVIVILSRRMVPSSERLSSDMETADTATKQYQYVEKSSTLKVLTTCDSLQINFNNTELETGDFMNQV